MFPFKQNGDNANYKRQDEIDKGFWIVVDSDLDIFDKVR